VLRVECIDKRFGGLQAIQQLSFEVNQGEIVGLIGPNGAGKTTVFNIISGFIRPDSGNICFVNEDITGLMPYQICKKGLVRTFQSAQPLGRMSTFDNIMVAGLNFYKTVRKARSWADEIIEFTGLKEFRDTPASGLTLLNRKRLEIARALATHCKFLLLDEVITGLNPIDVEKACLLIEEVRRRGATILIVEHIMKVIMSIADRIVVLNYGNKIAEGTPIEISRNPDALAAYLGEDFKVNNTR
jgi:branched-chain amino acid transport system ATP-binding protein